MKNEKDAVLFVIWSPGTPVNVEPAGNQDIGFHIQTYPIQDP
jgi:hypothetical protein